MTYIKHGATPRQVTSIKKNAQTSNAPVIPALKPTIHSSVFDALPDSAYVREAHLVPSPKRPDTPVPLPFSAPTLWRKVREGTFCKPYKLSERVTAWKVGEVRAWMAKQEAQAYAPAGINKPSAKRTALVMV